MARQERMRQYALEKDPLAHQLRVITGVTTLLVIAIAFVFLAVEGDQDLGTATHFGILMAALALAAVCFLPVWDLWPRDAFGAVFAGQAVLLGLFLYSTGYYHPWHAYWLLIAVLAGAHLSRPVLATVVVVVLLAALSPFFYAQIANLYGRVLNYWVEVPGYIVAASVTHLLFSRLRASRLETLDYAEAVDLRNVHLQGLYTAAETMASAVRIADVRSAAEASLRALMGPAVAGVSLALPAPLLKEDGPPGDVPEGAHTDPCIEHLLERLPQKTWQALLASEVMMSSTEDTGGAMGFLGFPSADRLLLLPVQGDPGLLGIACIGLRRTDLDAEVRSVLTTFRSLLRGTLLGFQLRREVGEKEAATRAGALKAEFVSAVSHELRTPLTTIQGFSELVVHRDDIGPASQRDVQRIHDAALHMEDIVSDLHELSLMEAGRLIMAPAPMSLHPLAREMAEEAGHASTIHRVGSTVPETIAPVMADVSRIRQVLSNLLTNAVKYSPTGGEVTIAAWLDGGSVVVEVRDQGLGIPPEEMDKVFQRFYRIKDGRHTLVRGTGLGLSISRQIVEAHGGRIWVESEPGKGSPFRFTLPRA